MDLNARQTKQLQRLIQRAIHRKNETPADTGAWQGVARLEVVCAVIEDVTAAGWAFAPPVPKSRRKAA